MVCKTCESKLSAVAAPDPWKTGSKNSAAGSSGRPIGQNKLLTKKARNPIMDYSNHCRTCKTRVSQAGAHFCQSCAYKAGICSMCGKKVLDTTGYKMSAK
ncbi:PDZ-binding protein [Hyaloraphidium curvatum]|nr:PDZ-binding protein [Hyaloraphidium curvatum]